MLTIAYITCRQDCRIEWFFSSLQRECVGNYTGIRVVVVDFHRESRSIIYSANEWQIRKGGGNTHWCAPKPTVWQGEHRLTKENWFAAANQRNTALCLAPDGFIAFVDDLSVLLPGWLAQVRKAMAENYIVCGAYKKVKDLKVLNGDVIRYTDYPQGLDNRLRYASDVAPCAGNWLYGCSVAGPVEAFLSVNGWPEINDGLGFEDCCMGIVLKNAGHDLRYDPKMMTYESEELHHVEPAFRKEDWHLVDGKPVKGGNGKDDKSHAALNIARQSKRFEYDVGGGFKDLRELRQHVLKGGQFPIRQNPCHDWYTGVPLAEL